MIFMTSSTDSYSEPCQTSKTEGFAKIVYGWKLHLRCLTGFWVLHWSTDLIQQRINKNKNFQRSKRSFLVTLHKMSNTVFYLISWCWNYVETQFPHRFGRIAWNSAETDEIFTPENKVKFRCFTKCNSIILKEFHFEIFFREKN